MRLYDKLEIAKKALEEIKGYELRYDGQPLKRISSEALKKLEGGMMELVATPKHEIQEAALKHYEHLSSIASEWNSYCKTAIMQHENLKTHAEALAEAIEAFEIYTLEDCIENGSITFSQAIAEYRKSFPKGER